MRFIDVVLGGALIGLIAGFLHTARPGDANAGTDVRAGERLTWLWMPVFRRPSPAH